MVKGVLKVRPERSIYLQHFPVAQEIGEGWEEVPPWTNGGERSTPTLKGVSSGFWWTLVTRLPTQQLPLILVLVKQEELSGDEDNEDGEDDEFFRARQFQSLDIA
jgi:hypothetical protein